jgi:hypothetical protein
VVSDCKKIYEIIKENYQKNIDVKEEKKNNDKNDKNLEDYSIHPERILIPQNEYVLDFSHSNNMVEKMSEFFTLSLCHVSFLFFSCFFVLFCVINMQSFFD